MKTDCPTCNRSDFKSEFPLKDQYNDAFNLCKCNNCSTHFLSPAPTDEQLSRAYANEYYGEGSKKFSPLLERILNYFRSRKAADWAKYLKEGDAVLDIGCADGEFLFQLSHFGNFKMFGLELEGKAAERAKERLNIRLHIGPLKSDTYVADQFDAISLIHVFEHLPKPAEQAAVISMLLKSGGSLLIEQPNIESWQAKIFKDKWLHLDPPRHLNLMDPDALIKLMDQHGFDHCTTHYFSIQFSPFGFQQSILNLLLSKREVLYEHLKGNKAYVKDYSSFSLFVQKLFHWGTFPFFILTDLIASAFNKGATMSLRFQKR